MTAIAEATITCQACPVQIEGRLDDGRWFYFRARFQRATLSAGADLEEAVRLTVFGDPSWNALVIRDLPELGYYGAGMIGEDEAGELLEEMLGELIDA